MKDVIWLVAVLAGTAWLLRRALRGAACGGCAGCAGSCGAAASGSKEAE